MTADKKPGVPIALVERPATVDRIGVVTVRQLVDATPALRRLSEKPLAIKAAYRLARLIHVVERELLVFNTQRERILKEMGESRLPTPEEMQQGAHGQVVTLPTARVPEFTAACDAMLDERATIDLPPFDLAQLGALPMSAQDVHLCGPLVMFNEGPQDGC
jgi:hypothetical protein